MLNANPLATMGELVRRVPLVVQENHSAREAADYMVETDVGRLIVVADDNSASMVGIVTRSDLMGAHSQRLKEAHQVTRHLSTPFRAKLDDVC